MNGKVTKMVANTKAFAQCLGKNSGQRQDQEQQNEGQGIPDQQGRRNGWKNHITKGLPARGAQSGSRFFQLFFGILQNRLHRSHDEWQTDKNECNDHAIGVERQLDAVRLQDAADPAVAGQQGGQ